MVTNCQLANKKHNRNGNKPRLVPAFTIQSLQRNTKVIQPQKINFYDYRTISCTSFRKFYDRRDLPIGIQPQPTGLKIVWKVLDIGLLDYHHYLPIFFDGIRETTHPYTFLAVNGSRDLIKKAPNKAFAVLPQLIIPMKKALNTKNPRVVSNVMKIIQFLVKSSPIIGYALVPYYRQILPTFNFFVHLNVNCGDDIDFTRERNENIGDLVNSTLQVLEQYGGEDAYINIKYLVPTYESCILFN